MPASNPPRIKMPKYFKDQKFMLVFLHSEAGIFVDNLADFILDAKTNKSLLIAARGDEEVEGLTLLSRKQTNDISSELDWFYYLKDHPEDQWPDWIKRDQNNSDWAKDLIRMGNSKAVTFLLALAYDDDGDATNVGLDSHTFSNIKRGGTELVSEFLLSNFCHRSSQKLFRRDGQPISDDESMSITFALGEIDHAIYEMRWTYDFSLAVNFDNLALTQVLDYDEDYGFEYSIPVFQHGINQKAVPYLNELVAIPYRVRKLLSEAQQKTLADEVPEIVKQELDYVAIRLLGQPVQNYKMDRATDYARLQGAAWASDMYDICGGDGEGNAYLGDGISITPDGHLVDD